MLARPPFGNVCPSILSACGSLGLSYVGWSVNTRDWIGGRDEAVGLCTRGSVVLFHDGGRVTQPAGRHAANAFLHDQGGTAFGMARCPLAVADVVEKRGEDQGRPVIIVEGKTALHGAKELEGQAGHMQRVSILVLVALPKPADRGSPRW